MNYIIKHIYRIVFVVVLSLPLVAQAALPDFTKIVDETKDSVVNISTKTRTRIVIEKVKVKVKVNSRQHLYQHSKVYNQERIKNITAAFNGCRFFINM